MIGRRELLRTASVVPLMTMTVPSADLPIFALARRIEAAAAAHELVLERLGAAETEFFRRRREKPDLPEQRRGEPAKAYMARYEAAIERWSIADTALRVEAGVTAAEDAELAAVTAVSTLTEQLAELPARTLPGLIEKLRMAQHDGTLQQAVCRDLLRMYKTGRV